MNYCKTYYFLLLLALIQISVFAQVRLPQLISNGMVLQRDKPIRIWGWASPGEMITVDFVNRTYHTSADKDGVWQIDIKAMKAGGPYIMKIDASNHLSIEDILIGDVWFCAGQSNMVTPMERVKEKYPDDIASANFPQIRNFFVPTAADISSLHNDLPKGEWKKADPVNVMNFGAVSYFMARQLYLKYHVPIGIINSSVGGTPIEAWMSTGALKNFPKFIQRLKNLNDTLERKTLKKTKQSADKQQVKVSDEGLISKPTWYDTALVTEDWKRFWLPGYWADQGVRNLNGVVWFRKEIDVPAEMAGKPAKLFVGRIIDADETYVNGIKLGGISYQYPPRRYNIAAGILKSGKNLIVVRVTSYKGKGGFVPDKRYELTDGVHHIDIRGDWLYKVGQVFTPPSSGMHDAAKGFSAQNEPTGLFNTMVYPATNYAIRGVAWYQGESSVGNTEYGQLLKHLFNDWRSYWKDERLPFIIAQLPGYGDVEYSPAESSWAVLREAQLQALALNNTALAVTIDAGEWNDIHPLNKKDVGERLALAAQKIAYHDKTVVSSGPLFSTAVIIGNRIVISFTNTGGGLIIKKGKKLNHFAIAGADKRFVWADAVIDGKNVIASSPDVAEPKYVRYAWADNPDGANLYNQEGLPASPFRTDND